MQTPTTVSPEDLKTAGHVLLVFAGFLFTAIGFLIRTAYKMGKDAQRVSTSLEQLTKIVTAVEQIPVIITRLGTVEEAWKTTRSDIKHLLRGSRPEISVHDDAEPTPNAEE